MRRVEVFAEIGCPFTHVGLRRLVDARRAGNRALAIRVHAWPLEFVNGRPIDPDTVALEIEALRSSVAPDLFAAFDVATFPRTSIPAFGLSAAAYARGESVGESVSLALRDAVFERGLDVTDTEVLRGVGAPFGVEPISRTDAETAARDDWSLGRERGVVGSPQFFVGPRSWFCPMLEIRHAEGGYDVSVDEEARRDFYAAALG